METTRFDAIRAAVDAVPQGPPLTGNQWTFTPANVVPMTAPADAERIAEAAREQARKFREGLGR